MTGATAADAILPSPCVGICRMDEATGWCLGCARDALELGAWRELPEAARRAVWEDLPRRKALLGLAFRLLPWQGEALLDRLADASQGSAAGWSIGVYGAVAEFAAPDGAAVEVVREPGTLLLRAEGGAARLRPPAGTRAFELVGASGRAERIVLALHRARLREAYAPGVAGLGADAEAIDPARQGDLLFDLGLGRAPIRFCVRTGDPGLTDALRAAAGRMALDPATGLVPHLLGASPDRVVASPLGRVEVVGPILREGRAGPHTHLVPDLLARGRALEPGFGLPEGYVACATLVPAGTAGGARAAPP